MSRHSITASIAFSALVALSTGAHGAAPGAETSPLAVPAPAPESPLSPDSGERIWVTQGASEPGLHENLTVRYTPELAAGDTITFECDAHCDDAIAEAVFQLRIRDAAGKVRFSADNSAGLEAGSNVTRFEWPTNDLADGEYTAQFVLIHSPGMVAAATELNIRRISRSAVRQSLEESAAKVAAMTRHLDQLAEKNDTPTYARVRLAVAEDALAEGNSALESSRWPAALDFARYASRTVGSIGAQLALADEGSEVLQSVSEPGLASLGRVQGEFTAGETPVFLVGVSEPSARADTLTRLRRYGLNLYAFAVGPADTLADERRARELGPMLDAVFAEAKKENVSLACALSQTVLPEWTRADWASMRAETTPGNVATVNLADSQVQAIIERHLRASLAYFSRQSMVNSIALVQRPEFNWGGDKVRAGFTAYVAEIYKDRDAVNAAWRKRLRGMEDVDIWWDYSRSAYQFDWQTYHAQLGTEYLAELNASAKDLASGMAFRVDVSDAALQNGKREAPLKRESSRRNQSLDDPRDLGVGRGDSAQGVDRESVAKMYDVTGCQTTVVMNDPVYSLNYPAQSLLYTLLRSFAPDKPLIDSDMVLTPAPGFDAPHTYRYIHSALWDAALSGLNAAAVHGDPDSSGAWSGTFTLPEAREALAIACLDLNRLAPIVAAFQNAPAEVAILWSMPSKIYEKGYPYLPSIRRAYEGCSFGGRRVRFVSEIQCAQQGLDGVAILVLPQMLAVSESTFHAIQDYVKKGGVIIRSGTPIPYNERGASRQDVISNSLHTILVRGVDSPSQYLHALDAAYALGTIEDVPRVVNEDGYPMEGVKSFFTSFQGERYLYLLNIRTTAARCLLQGSTQSGRDLIQGREVTFPHLLAPLEPALIRLRHQDSAPTPALDVAATASRTTVVRPVDETQGDAGAKRPPGNPVTSSATGR